MFPNFKPLVDFFHKSIKGLLWLILVRHLNELFKKVKIEHHVIKFTLVSQQHLQKHLLKWSEHFFASSTSNATDSRPEHVNVHTVDCGIFLANFIHRTHEISQSTFVFVTIQFVFEDTNFSKSLIYELLLSNYLGYSVEADTRFYYVLISRLASVCIDRWVIVKLSHMRLSLLHSGCLGILDVFQRLFEPLRPILVVKCVNYAELFGLCAFLWTILPEECHCWL